jgi:hypothetical protein
MSHASRRYRVLFLGMSAALLPAACSTQEIGADPVLIPDTTPSADHGMLQIGFAPLEASFEEQQAKAAEMHAAASFHVFVDGQQLAWSSDFDGSLQPFVVSEAGTASIGYLPAGSHHIEIRAPGGGSTVYGGDGEIAAGSTTELFLFGPAGAIAGRFVSYPPVVAAGTAHVVVINLIRTGQSLEAVKCADTSHCTPVSSPLALGETFEGDFPIDATQDWPNGRFIVSDDGGLGYRQVPTPAVPDPPVLPLYRGVIPVDGPTPPGETLVAAPIYMSPSGDIQESF